MPPPEVHVFTSREIARGPDDDAGEVRTVGDVVRIVQASLAACRDPYFNA